MAANTNINTTQSESYSLYIGAFQPTKRKLTRAFSNCPLFLSESSSDNTTAQCFEYRPLTEPDGIRLIELQQSLDPRAQIWYSLIHTTLSSCEFQDVFSNYVALSYVVRTLISWNHLLSDTSIYLIYSKNILMQPPFPYLTPIMSRGGTNWLLDLSSGDLNTRLSQFGLTKSLRWLLSTCSLPFKTYVTRRGLSSCGPMAFALIKTITERRIYKSRWWAKSTPVHQTLLYTLGLPTQTASNAAA
jgi:hypothetical protein